MASIIGQPFAEIERVADMLLSLVIITTLATALLAVTSSGLARATRWIRHRRSSLVPGESMFVGRWGQAGGELFVVGADVRRLLPAAGRNGVARGLASEVVPVLAARLLLETLGRHPTRNETWAFVEERLTPLPPDGFTLPVAEVVAWLDARHAVRSDSRNRVLELVGARLAAVACRVRPAPPSMIEQPDPAARNPAERYTRERGPIPPT